MNIISFNPPEKNRRKLLTPLLVSFLIHIIVILPLVAGYKEEDAPTKPERRDYIEITELPVPEEQETEPPEEAKILAERSRKAEEERTIDEQTRLTRQTPVVETMPTEEQQEQPQEQKAEEPAAREPVAEEPQKDEKRTEVAEAAETEDTEPHRTEEDIPSEPEVSEPEPKEETKTASVAGEDSRETAEREQERDFGEIGRKLLRSAPPSPPVSEAPEDPREQLLGSRTADKKEDTVDLSTQEFKYVSYFTNLKRKIEGVWNYPQESRMRGEQGKLFLEFTINSNGELEQIRLLDSSGYRALDNEAIRAIEVAAPYNPFPESWGELERLHIRASFEYHFRRFIR